MAEPALVSIIMNCFNGEKFLREAIDSIISQTYTNWELIFWDNQSTDYSSSIVKSYNDVRIKYFYASSHTLLYEARNHAFQKTTGALVAFLDVDDIWLPEKLEKQVPLFLDSEVGFSCTNYWIKNQFRGEYRLAFKEVISGHALDQLMRKYTIGLLTLILRKSAFPSIMQPFDSRYHIIGDFDLAMRLSVSWKLASVQEPLATYRIHGSNATTNHRELWVAELEIWHEENSKNSIFGNSTNFHNIKSQINYRHGLNALINGKRLVALDYLFKIRWSWLKLRLLCALFLPLYFIRMLKN
jgi:glycosyltransferase involved in cell wall biosynthesis